MRSLSGASLTGVAMLTLGIVAASGCAKVGQLQAMKNFKAANQAYQQQDYKKSAGLYEDTVAADPNLSQAYFFLGNSYDNLYKPSKKGEAANDQLLTKAVENYQKAADKLTASADPKDKALAKLSLQYLVAAYGPEKLNDPVKAEPVLQNMIREDPGDPAVYFQLAKLYEDAGVYEEAERILIAAKTNRPADPSVYTTLAGYYNRQGHFDKTIEALEERASKEPNNPEAFHTIAVYYWDEAYRDFKLKEAEKRAFVQKGVEAVDRALQIKADYMEALVYKNLLLRLEANMEKDHDKAMALVKQADQLRDKAEELRKKKAAGVTS